MEANNNRKGAGMISEKVLSAITAYGVANQIQGDTEIRMARRRLEIEIEIYANEIAIEGLKQASEKIVNKATQKEKGRE